ncbi:MAG: 2-hydroxychromene-2-carboxylate isomerase [Burkholderiaceae bacterium]|nr:2-hydroxychromene-2-carboxylate isomerase [Burkholderiaceae bacterium]
MKQITFYLDFISPYACLAFEHLPRALEGVSYGVHYRPLLLGALFKHHDNTPPPQVPSKHQWIGRHVLWLGHTHGIPIEMPASHPYNPLPHLRLALATSHDGDISRDVAETIFRAVWRGGGEAIDPQRLATLEQRLPCVHEANGDAVKAQLKANTDAAIAAGVFGVPTFEVEGRLFWGFDSLPMLRACLEGDAWFSGPDWDAAPRRLAALRRPID